MRRLTPSLFAGLAVLPAFVATAVLAADGTAPLTSGADSFSLVAAIFKALGALLLILGLMLLMAKLFRKFGTKVGLSQGAMINILETRMLGPKKQLTVVEIGGEVLVVGVTDQQINLVTRLDDPSRLLRPAATNARPAASGRIRRDSGFAALLDRAVRPAAKKATEEESHD